MLQFNIHNDQGAAKSCNFKVDAKYPAESSNFYEDKKSPVEIDRLLKISFQFLSSGPSFSFLSDPSPILVYPCHWLIPWLTDSLTHSCLVNLISVTLACGDGNSKPVEAVTVVEVGHKTSTTVTTVQDFEVVSQMWSWEQVGEQWLHAAWKLNTFTHTLGDKTYVHSIWEDSINNDDVKDHHHHHFVFSTLVALWWPAAINPMFAKANRSVCYPNWIFAQPNLIFA